MKRNILIPTLYFITNLLLISCNDDNSGTTDFTAPGEVTSLTAIASDASVVLEWDIPEDEDLAQVQITFSPTTDLTQPIPLSPEYTSKEITDLENGVEYTFTVKTVDENANKSDGSSVQATPVEPDEEEEVVSEMTDSRDNTIYSIVTIGTQTWMAENLAYLPDDEYLSAISEGSHTNAFTKQYYAYDFDNGGSLDDANDDETVSEYIETYGLLYNWYAAIDLPSTVTDTVALKEYLDSNTVVQGICPDGWHLPTDNEYKTLEEYLGMSEDDADETGYRGSNAEGDDLKSTDLWETEDGDNSVGFDLRPAGRWKNETFQFLTQYSYLWTSSLSYCETRTNDDSTQYVGSNPWLRYFKHNESRIARQAWEDFNGYSVRCIKDSDE